MNIPRSSGGVAASKAVVSDSRAPRFDRMGLPPTAQRRQQEGAAPTTAASAFARGIPAAKDPSAAATPALAVQAANTAVPLHVAYEEQASFSALRQEQLRQEQQEELRQDQQEQPLASDDEGQSWTSSVDLLPASQPPAPEQQNDQQQRREQHDQQQHLEQHALPDAYEGTGTSSAEAQVRHPPSSCALRMHEELRAWNITSNRAGVASRDGCAAATQAYNNTDNWDNCSMVSLADSTLSGGNAGGCGGRGTRRERGRGQV